MKAAIFRSKNMRELVCGRSKYLLLLLLSLGRDRCSLGHIIRPEVKWEESFLNIFNCAAFYPTPFHPFLVWTDHRSQCDHHQRKWFHLQPLANNDARRKSCQMLSILRRRRALSLLILVAVLSVTGVGCSVGHDTKTPIKFPFGQDRSHSVFLLCQTSGA